MNFIWHELRRVQINSIWCKVSQHGVNPANFSRRNELRLDQHSVWQLWSHITNLNLMNCLVLGEEWFWLQKKAGMCPALSCCALATSAVVLKQLRKTHSSCGIVYPNLLHFHKGLEDPDWGGDGHLYFSGVITGIWKQDLPLGWSRVGRSLNKESSLQHVPEIGMISALFWQLFRFYLQY